MATEDDLCSACTKPLGDDAPNAVETQIRVTTDVDQLADAFDVGGDYVILHPACYAADPNAYITPDGATA